MTTRFSIALLAATALGSVALAPHAVAQETAPMTKTMTTEAMMMADESINAPYNDILSTYLTEKDGINLFDYGAVTPEDRKKLQDYIKTLEAQTPSAMSQNDAIAYWANLYNAVTLEVILENYPVKSIRDIGGNLIFKGPWRDEVVTVEGNRMSLDNIEHDTVRAQFDEPRIHYAFNCASIGCPNLGMTAWEGATLDEDLDVAARAYIAHDRGIKVEGRRVTASSIYKWFKEDFGTNDQEILDHIRQYATGDKAEALKDVTRINRYEYDWSLNDG